MAAELLDSHGFSVDDSLELDFGRDVIEALECADCETSEEIFAPLGSLTEESARCSCGAGRAPRLRSRVSAEDTALLERTPGELGLPPWDILVARCGEAEVGLELDGDRELVLGALAEAREGVDGGEA